MIYMYIGIVCYLKKFVLYFYEILQQNISIPSDKTTDLSQVTDKLYHIMLYRGHLDLVGLKARNVSGDRC
jgi:hypothetical protein